MNNKYLNEIKSFATTFISVFFSIIAVDSFDTLSLLWNGDFSHATLVALGLACVRVAVKTILILAFPGLFKQK